MGEFFADAETVRIDFPDGQWVDVKEELSQEDSDYLLSKIANAEQLDGNPRLTLAIGRLPLLERSIIAWSFDAPVTTENISKLRVKYRDQLLKEIDQLNLKASGFVLKNA